MTDVLDDVQNMIRVWLVFVREALDDLLEAVEAVSKLTDSWVLLRFQC